MTPAFNPCCHVYTNISMCMACNFRTFPYHYKPHFTELATFRIVAWRAPFHDKMKSVLIYTYSIKLIFEEIIKYKHIINYKIIKLIKMYVDRNKIKFYLS
jgi:hypothetical protein